MILDFYEKSTNILYYLMFYCGKRREGAAQLGRVKKGLNAPIQLREEKKLSFLLATKLSSENKFILSVSES